MPLVKLTITGDKAGRGLWVNSVFIMEVVESRERDFVRMAGGIGNSGTYTIDVESAAATAKAIQDAESPPQPYRLHP